MVNLLPPPKPTDWQTNVTGGGDLDKPEDRIVASQPKVVTINILTGEGASLIKNLIVKEIQDGATGMVSPYFQQSVTDIMYNLMSDSSQLLAKQVIR
jgi:hypothetical protein